MKRKNIILKGEDKGEEWEKKEAQEESVRKRKIYADSRD